jgi:hypothetical protein
MSNAAISRQEMNLRGQTHGVVNNTPSAGALLLVYVLVGVETYVLVRLFPYLPW